MTTPRDVYWDELGIAWCAINPEINVIGSRLRTRLRRQSALIAAALAIGLPVSVAGLLLGAYTLWSGWTTGAWNFVTRGLALATISVLLATALLRLLPVKASDAAKALAEMLDLAIARMQRILATVQLGLWACGLAAVFGLAGSAIRTYLAKPPAISPVVDLAVVAIVALGLLLYGRHTKVTLEKLRYLKQVLALDAA